MLVENLPVKNVEKRFYTIVIIDEVLAVIGDCENFEVSGIIVAIKALIDKTNELLIVPYIVRPNPIVLIKAKLLESFTVDAKAAVAAVKNNLHGLFLS